MKKSALGLIFLPLATHFILACSPSESIHLRDSRPLNNFDEHESPKKPEPSPEPTPTPAEPGHGDDLLPTPPPQVSKVARIMCESQPLDARAFNTLRADVFSNYIMPTLTPYVNGRYVLRVKSPLPLQSNGEQAFLILRAQEDNFTPWKIYKSAADLLAYKGDLQLLSNFQGPVQSSLYIYQSLKMESRLLAANIKRSAYVYPDDSGAYVWESLKGSRLLLPFSAETSFSPQFVGGDDYLRFDQLAANGNTLIQKFYHFDTKKTLSIPTPAEAKDSQLFGYINSAKNTLFWVEGRAEGTWKLRSMSLRPGAKAVTLTTLPGNPKSLVLPMVLFEHQGETILAYSEEEVAHDLKAQPYFKTSSLHLIKAGSKSLKLMDTQSIPYSDKFKMYVRSEQAFAQGVLRHLFLEPISGKLYASNIPKGGLVSFDLTSNSWEVHAMYESVFGCLNPQWGIEVPRE